MIINNTDIKIGGAFIEVGTKYFAASTHTFNSNLFLGKAKAEVNLESNRAYKRFNTRHFMYIVIRIVVTPALPASSH